MLFASRQRLTKSLVVCGMVVGTIVGFAYVATKVVVPVGAAAADPEPIAYIGHGAFFDAEGNEIHPTAEFLQRAQAWYRAKLLASTTSLDHQRLSTFELKLTKGLQLDPQNRLLADQAALIWLATRAPSQAADTRTLGKLRALEYRLALLLPSVPMHSTDPTVMQVRSELGRRLQLSETLQTVGSPGTQNAGKAYVDECAAAGVPIPPPIGQLDATGAAGWKSQGFLPASAQFIVQTIAEVRTYQNANGVCYALPRYEDDTKTKVVIDGVICLSATTSKVCFWDNQMHQQQFDFATGTKIPIGFPDPSVNAAGLYQAGGAELDGGAGGVCTDCHAGENPFVVHPKVDLGNGMSWGSVESALPAFGPDLYKPIVAQSWPQNAAPEKDANVPQVCAACHTQGGEGRFPALSQSLKGYCNTILPQAIKRTMPPQSPGSQDGTPAIKAFLALCGPKL